ncbi:transposase, partial [Escherichia coli 5412]
MKKHSLPDWATVHRELRNKCVTLQLLWEEYCERNPGGFYSYNHYCRMYREWLKTTSPSMRQVHKAGEKLFVGLDTVSDGRALLPFPFISKPLPSIGY